MASSEAQAFFNKQSPADQQAIRASWGGKDMMDQWYQAAKAAGSVPDPMANTGGQGTLGKEGTTTYTGPADTTKWKTDVEMTDNAHPDALAGPSGDPFVDMVRASAKGKSEDFERFSNAQILGWKGYYDPEASKKDGRPRFKNEFGDIVDKPTESGANSQAAGYATGSKEGGKAGAGGAGGGAKPAGTGAESSGNPLQDALVRSFQNREGQFVNAGVQGAELGQGGVFWTDPTAVNPTAPQTGGAEPRPAGQGNTLPTTAGQYGGINPAANGPGNAALVSATLNAFTPNAPSATGAGTGGAVAAAAPAAVNQWTGGAQPGTVETPKWSQPTSEVPPLDRKLANQFARQNRAPQEWWRAQ